MASIGSLAVQLSLDAALFTSGIDRATKEGKAFAANFTSTFAGIGAGIAGIQGIGDIGRGAFESIKASTDKMVAQGRQASELGLSLRELGAVNLLAAGDTAGMTTALTHMSAELGKAAREGGEAAAPFRGLNLDVKKLMDLPAAERIGQITSALDKLGNINQKTDLARSIFGRGGLDAADKLSEGLSGALGKVDLHGGVGFSPEDLKMAKETQQAFGEMSASFDKIGMAAASELAPVLKYASEWGAEMTGKWLPEIRQEFKGAALGIVDGLELAIKDTSALITLGHRIEVQWEKISYWVTSLDRVSWMGLKVLGNGLGLQNKPSDAFEKGLKLEVDHLLALSEKARGAIDSMGGKPTLDAGLHEDKTQDGDAPGGGSWADISALTDKTDALNLKLHDQISAFGLGADAMDRYKLAGLGASDAQLKGIDSSLAELTAMRSLTEEVGRGSTIFQQAGSKMADTFAAMRKGNITFGESLSVLGKQFEDFQKKADVAFNNIVEAARSPLSKLKDEMQNLRYLRDIGDSKGIKLSSDQFASALSKDFLSVSPAEMIGHAPGALQFGSMEAHSADVAWQRQGEGGNIQEQIKSAIDRMAETEKQHLAVSRALVALLPDLLQGRSLEQ